ncbi:MAG: sigma-70 family RNA polymerase sigma factor [Chloroflexota bacterium]|nr:sigma-70 family RNA polymerase sigma factor [Chloroflexota bacterium]
MDEVWLAQRAREGDSDAFEEIFRIYHTRIYNYVYRLVGNADDAQDLTQDSFLKAYRSLTRGAQPANLSAWLYRIASNTCLDMLRRRRLIHWQPLENLLAVLHIAGDRSPEEQVLHSERQAEQRAEVERVLAQLPPRYRMYLILREREGFSYQEIASITGDSLDTVKVTLYRARERARQSGSKLRSMDKDE